MMCPASSKKKPAVSKKEKTSKSAVLSKKSLSSSKSQLIKKYTKRKPVKAAVKTPSKTVTTGKIFAAVKKRRPLRTQEKRSSRISAERKFLETPLDEIRDKSNFPTPILTDLPFSYNDTHLVILVRDPEWAFGYWDFSSSTWDWVVRLLNQDHRAKPKLRVHNLSQQSFYDLDVYLEARNWYVHLGLPGTSYEAELGILDSAGKFHLICRSNRFHTPRNCPSDVIDPAWALSEAEMRRLYELSGGGRTGHGSEIFSSFRRR